MEKSELRKNLIMRLKGISEQERTQSDAAILQNLQALPEWKSAKTVSLFLGGGWEVRTDALFASAIAEGKRVCVPLCRGENMEMRFVRGKEDFVRSTLGVLEAKDTCPLCPPNEIDFLVLPCVACDKKHHRLGRGGGYYDRYLRLCPAPTAALCRKCVLQDALPSDEWDKSVTYVVTDGGIY